MAKFGAFFTVLASASLSIVALWIFVLTMSGNGMPEPAPTGMLALIALFIAAMVLAFLNFSVVFLQQNEQRTKGYLLTVPLLMWGIMLVVSLTNGVEVGLSLDFYTNGVIGAAFLYLGFILNAHRNTSN